jgi:ubiquinone/menaquinone biosynthesis C-methylase UbiE
MNKTRQATRFLSQPAIHEEWESDFLNPGLDPFWDLLFGKVVDHLGAKRGDRILDAGCGYCFHAARLARAGLHVTGVDMSPAALSAARKALDGKGLSIELQQGNLLDLPFKNGSFPFVGCWGVLMHIPEVERALEELARVLQRGGKLCLMENNVRSLHVRGWEAAVRGVKRMLSRPRPRRDRKPQGIEEWREEGLMVRKIDVDWLTGFYKARGLKLVDRFAAQFTEAYTNMPTKSLKKLVYRFNERWVANDRSPRLALGNILIFEKS